MTNKDNTSADSFRNMDSFRVNKRAWELVLARINELNTQGMSWAKIGRLLGVHRSTILVWNANQKGGERTSFRDMVRYIDRLQIPLEEVFKECTGTLPDPTPQPRLAATKLDHNISKTLSDVATALGETPESISAETGESPRDVAHMLSGERPMLAGEFYRVCNAVGVSPANVLDRAAKLTDDNGDDTVRRSA